MVFAIAFGIGGGSNPLQTYRYLIAYVGNLTVEDPDSLYISEELCHTHSGANQMQTSRILLLPKIISLSLLLLLILVVAACSGPTLPELPAQSQGEESLAVEIEDNDTETESVASAETDSMTESESDKQAGVAAAAETVAESDNAADDTLSEAAIAEVPAEEAQAEPAPTTVDNWLTVTSRVDHELPAIGNPDAPLIITEFSDFM